VRHDWQVTGGYDPALDGPWPQWGRVAVRCAGCGQARRIWQGLSLDDPGLTYGCPAGPVWITGAAPRQPAPFTAAPELAVLLAASRARCRVFTALTLLGVLLSAWWVLAYTTGTYPPLLISWAIAMGEAGLFTWGVMTLRRPPPGLGSAHGEHAAGGVHGGPDGGDGWQQPGQPG
jgi:hypothetical protein